MQYQKLQKKVNFTGMVRYLSFPEIQSAYCDFIDDCSTLIHYTSAKSLQERKIQEIEQEIYKVKHYKAQFISAREEDFANELFHMQCMLNAVRCILCMWMEIKNSNFSEAWFRLIDAQEYIDVALMIRDYEGVRLIEKFLLKVEDTIFPRRSLYISRGTIETIGQCSICSANFFLCDHLENKVYMGKLCRRVERRIVEWNHVALVKSPKDKRCIVTHIEDDNGNMIDYFTGKICEDIKDQDKINIKGKRMKCILLHFNPLDFD